MHNIYPAGFSRFSWLSKMLGIIFLICHVSHADAQQKKTAVNSTTQTVKKQPYWVNAMDDPDANYYKAVSDFNAFWKNKIRPIEEDELFETGGEKDREEALRERKQGKLRNSDAAVIYAFEYKRFMHWKNDAEHLVKPDGHIKSVEDRLKEWEQLQENARLKTRKPAPGNTNLN